jgi:Protein of unknown function (DUF2599)
MQFLDAISTHRRAAIATIAMFSAICALGRALATPPVAAALSLCGSKIASADWAYNSVGNGYTLHVHPSGCGRATAALDPHTAFDQAIAKATHIPQGQHKGWDPNPGSLFEQFECHARSGIALVKSSWNLDAWRPEVSWVTEIREKCNPKPTASGSESPGPGVSQTPTSVGSQLPTPNTPTGSSGPVFTVMNTSETLPDGIWFRTAPYMADTERITGLGPYMNEQVELLCYQFGEAVGPYSDRLWYQANDITRPTVDGRPNTGYLNAHFINDGLLANQIDSGVLSC